MASSPCLSTRHAGAPGRRPTAAPRRRPDKALPSENQALRILQIAACGTAAPLMRPGPSGLVYSPKGETHPPVEGRVIGYLGRPVTLVAMAMVCAGTVALRAGQAPSAGRTVWNGVFTAAQAERGRQQFTANCAECHGNSLQGTGDGKSLRGEAFWTDWRESSVHALLAYVSKNMPRLEDGRRAAPRSWPASIYLNSSPIWLSAKEFPRENRI